MRAFGLLQDATVGYGYRPIRAALWLLLLTCAGTVLFALNPAAPAQPGHGLAFHPLVYTLDLLLPVVDFGQEHAFTPVGAMQWFAYSLIAAGWILATSALTGLTRLLNRG
jgi:hypothetical protein